MVEVVEPIGNLMIGFKWTAPFVHLQVITLFKCTRMQINKAFGLQAIMKAIQINSCDTDGDWGCCDLNNYYSDFSGDRCYPYWYRLEANCGGETDWMEIVYNGARVNGDSYKCSNYDNCKGFWYGDNCQYYVAPYNENTECKVSMVIVFVSQLHQFNHGVDQEHLILKSNIIGENNNQMIGPINKH